MSLNYWLVACVSISLSHRRKKIEWSKSILRGVVTIPSNSLASYVTSQRARFQKWGRGHTISKNWSTKGGKGWTLIILRNFTHHLEHHTCLKRYAKMKCAAKQCNYNSRVSMYIYIHTYIHIYICKTPYSYFIWLHLFMYIHTYINMCVCGWVFVWWWWC